MAVMKTMANAWTILLMYRYSWIQGQCVIHSTPRYGHIFPNIFTRGVRFHLILVMAGRTCINVHYPLLGVTSANVVLKDGLSTCSECKRVMVDGFIKVWAPNHKPLFIGPDRVQCIIPRLHNRMAYLGNKTITTTIEDTETIRQECGVRIKDETVIIPLKVFGRSVKLRPRRDGTDTIKVRVIKRRKCRYRPSERRRGIRKFRRGSRFQRWIIRLR